MKKISSGRKRDLGKTWFPELSDKRKCICNYLLLLISGFVISQKYQASSLLGYEELW